MLITLARKPIQKASGTIGQNCLQFGTGGLNTDGCRVGDRWPANVILTGTVNMAVFPDTGGGSFQRGGPPRSGSLHFDQISNRPRTNAIMNYGDQGSASRYYKQIA
jgi:hypothetical protein